LRFHLLLLPHDVNVTVLPVGLPQLDGAAAHVLAVQLLHGASEVGWVFEADETEAFMKT